MKSVAFNHNSALMSSCRFILINNIEIASSQLPIRNKLIRPYFFLHFSKTTSENYYQHVLHDINMCGNTCSKCLEIGLHRWWNGMSSSFQKENSDNSSRWQIISDRYNRNKRGWLIGARNQLRVIYATDNACFI